MTVSNSLRSSNVPEGWRFQLCCFGGSVLKTPQNSREPVFASSSVVFYRKREGTDDQGYRIENYLYCWPFQSTKTWDKTLPNLLNNCAISNQFYFCPFSKLSNSTLFTNVFTPFASGYGALLLPSFYYLQDSFFTTLLIKTNCRNKHIKICPAVV